MINDLNIYLDGNYITAIFSSRINFEIEYTKAKKEAAIAAHD